MVVRLADRRSDGCQGTVVVNGFFVFKDVFEHKHVESALRPLGDYVTFNSPYYRVKPAAGYKIQGAG